MTIPSPTPKRGRPQGAVNLKPLVQGFAAQKHIVRTENGPEEITTAELVIRLLQAAFIKGNRKAGARLDTLRARFEPREGGGFLVVPDALPPEEWWRRREIENRFAKRPTLEDLDAAAEAARQAATQRRGQ